jgi:hypothetical protein
MFQEAFVFVLITTSKKRSEIIAFQIICEASETSCFHDGEKSVSKTEVVYIPGSSVTI